MGNTVKVRKVRGVRTAFAALAALLVSSAFAAEAFKFASVCSDDMVIQRGVSAPVWGFGKPGAKVSLALNGMAVGSAEIDAEGRWLIKLPPQKANARPSELTATCGKSKATIGNVLFGDVWFGCGQSNMAFTFDGYGRPPVGGDEFIKKAAGNPLVRTLMMNGEENKNCGFPRADALGIKWQTAKAEEIRKCGAALYWMGAKLADDLNVPIGLVNASWGATKIDGWQDMAFNEHQARRNSYAAGIGRFWMERRRNFIAAGGLEGYRERLKAFNDTYIPARRYLKGEPGYRDGTPTLHDAAFDDSKWLAVTPTAQGLASGPFANFAGTFWMRTVIDLSAEDAKKNWSISFGGSHGQDMTYVNGMAIGGSGAVKHGYAMRNLKPGKNVVVVEYRIHRADAGGGLHEPVTMAVWPTMAQRRELKFKALVGKSQANVRPPDNPNNVNMFTPGSMHNGLVQPLYPMAIKGAVWYQGCSDLGNGKYKDLFEALVAGWRANFTYADKLPVILTEIAPHAIDSTEKRLKAGETEKPTWSVTADIRLTLNQLGEEVPDCGTVSLLDLGEPDIHPIHKEEVGDRWCRWALEHVYGRAIEGSSPVVESVEWKGPKAILKLKHAKGLRTRDGKPVKGFELAGPPVATTGKDGKPTDAVTYYYAKAVIVGDTIELTCPQVKEAFGVRYAWFDLDLGWNVVNGAGLPLGVLRVFKDGKYHSQAK